MKQIKIRFEKDRLLPHIEITIRSKEQDDQVNDLIQKISSMNTEMLMITDINNVTYSISFDSIILFSIEGKQLNILTEGDNYTVYQSLQSIERLLDPINFIRISRNEIVNLKKVKHFDFSIGGTLCLKLCNDKQVWASRRCIPVIRKRINKQKNLEHKTI